MASTCQSSGRRSGRPRRCGARESAARSKADSTTGGAALASRGDRATRATRHPVIRGAGPSRPDSGGGTHRNTDRLECRSSSSPRSQSAKDRAGSRNRSAAFPCGDAAPAGRSSDATRTSARRGGSGPTAWAYPDPAASFRSDDSRRFDGEPGVHTKPVVSGNVADEHVLPRREVECDGRGLPHGNARELADLAVLFRLR